jgi:lipoate-protein ligase A
VNAVQQLLHGFSDLSDASPGRISARANAHEPSAATCRLILDDPADGAWNMAVDEMLLEQAAAGSGPCLRIYGWQRPTLSLGYFQKYAAAHEWLVAGGRDNVRVVRRPSGGGAILHDREITYALVLPQMKGRVVGGPALYRCIHGGLCAALRRQGIATQLRGGARLPRVDTQPFFCFRRSSEGDLLCGNRKAGGSAQRRRRGAVLQHGSLILAASPTLPEIRGLDLGERAEPLAAALLPCIVEEIAACLGLRLEPSRLAPSQQALAARLVQTKHGSKQWTQRR